jgi:hypothetical protein
VAVSYRPMKAAEVPECVSIVATHPLIAPRYSNVLNNLETVWISLLGREAFRAVVFEDTREDRVKLLGLGVSAFVSDEFLHALKRPPFVWIGPELTSSISRGESPLLSDQAVREANSKGGLNLVSWEGAIRPKYWKSAEVHATVISAFVDQHRGFLLKEVIGQPPTLEALEVTLRSGTQLFHEKGRYVDSADRPLLRVAETPYYVGLTRDVALSRPGAWMASLFIYQTPKCNFRPSEQRLLLAALHGLTDEELASQLGISVSAVKKVWLCVYERVSARLPSLLQDRGDPQEHGERGKEKKQHLLAYLRNHPEELRPAGMRS